MSQMKPYCFKCGAELDPEAIYCPECGRLQRSMVVRSVEPGAPSPGPARPAPAHEQPLQFYPDREAPVHPDAGGQHPDQPDPYGDQRYDDEHGNPSWYRPEAAPAEAGAAQPHEQDPWEGYQQPEQGGDQGYAQHGYEDQTYASDQSWSEQGHDPYGQQPVEHDPAAAPEAAYGQQDGYGQHDGYGQRTDGYGQHDAYAQHDAYEQQTAEPQQHTGYDEPTDNGTAHATEPERPSWYRDPEAEPEPPAPDAPAPPAWQEATHPTWQAPQRPSWQNPQGPQPAEPEEEPHAAASGPTYSSSANLPGRGRFGPPPPGAPPPPYTPRRSFGTMPTPGAVGAAGAAPAGNPYAPPFTPGDGAGDRPGSSTVRLVALAAAGLLGLFLVGFGIGHLLGVGGGPSSPSAAAPPPTTAPSTAPSTQPTGTNPPTSQPSAMPTTGTTITGNAKFVRTGASIPGKCTVSQGCPIQVALKNNGEAGSGAVTVTLTDDGGNSIATANIPIPSTDAGQTATVNGFATGDGLGDYLRKGGIVHITGIDIQNGGA